MYASYDESNVLSWFKGSALDFGCGLWLIDNEKRRDESLGFWLHVKMMSVASCCETWRLTKIIFIIKVGMRTPVINDLSFKER